MWLRKMNKTLFVTIFGVAMTSNALLHAQQLAKTHGSEAARNLRAIRKGDKVELTWRQPLAIADQQSTKKRLVLAQVCRSVSSTAPSLNASEPVCSEAVGKISLRNSAAPFTNTAYGSNKGEVAMRYTDLLPQNLR